MRRKDELLFLLMTLCACPVAALYQTDEDDYVQNTLSQCMGHLYKLVLCLADDQPIRFQITKCDNLLTKAFICLASRSNGEHAQFLPETEEDGQYLPEDSVIEKRGLGRCIHKCLTGQGGMNFIQCKSMCH